MQFYVKWYIIYLIKWHRPSRKEITMKKICILNRTCMYSNYYKIINSCKGKYEVVRNIRDADWCIFPYCSCSDFNIDIIEEELKKSLKMKKENCKVIVTGCIFFVKEEKRKFLEKYKIDYLVPMENQVEEICKILDVIPSNSVYNHYQIIGEVKIADGCLNHCAFCRMHYSNRPLKSVPIEEIIDQVEDLISKGIKFLRIVGLNTTQYGLDLYGKKMLPVLLQRISKIEGVKGIEVWDCALSDMDDEIANEIYCNDVVIAISMDMQSGSDPLLKRMNVGFDVKKIRKYFTLLKDKIRYTQIVTGFPGETEEDVKNTVRLLQKLQIFYFKISKYENSKDTPSGKMQGLSLSEVMVHNAVYNTMQKLLRANWNMKHNGEHYVGYVSKISLESFCVYCPELGEVKVFQEGQRKLMDKVEVLLENGKYLFVRVVEESTKKTDFPKESSNQLVDFMTNLKDITTDFTMPIPESFALLTSIFNEYGGQNLEEEDFRKAISLFPKVLQDALMTLY